MRREATTPDSGVFTITSLPPGRFAAQGFASYTETALSLEAGLVRRVIARLEVGRIQQEVTVSAPLPAIDTETPAKGATVPEPLLNTLPLNGRNYADLVVLAPEAYHRVDPSEQGDGFSAAGARGDSATFTLDGVLNRSDRNGTAGIAPSLDSVREFTVQTSTYSAESGRSGGAQVTVVSKSGANRVAGSGFDYVRNDAFDARNPFTPPGTEPMLRRNQGGGTLGGPIRRDRIFFFGAFETLRARESQAANTTAPMAARRFPERARRRPGQDLGQRRRHEPHRRSADAQRREGLPGCGDGEDGGARPFA